METKETREAYIDKLAAKLKEYDARVSELQAKIEAADADARIEHRRQLDEIESRKSDLQKNLEEAKRSGSKAWEELKGGLERSWKDLEVALDRAKNQLS